ncbi:MAG: HIT domain-containing protein [Nitrososphaeria archaeon]
MRRLWAPWRMEYISSAARGGACVLCDAAKGPDEEKLVLYRGRTAYVIMNRFPYNSGHLMVVPVRHVTAPGELSDEEALEVHHLISASIAALRRVMNPDAFNVGVNVGRHAGAGMDHLHYHVVPRWAGDTNFMPVLADVKVLPEHLRVTYERLRPALEEAVRGSTSRGRA